MAKFLDTAGVSYHLQELIKNTRERLILISPYLDVNDRIRQLLEDKDRLKIDVRVIYGKSALHPAEEEWIDSLSGVRLSFLQNLHAKCYLNEREAIITSMNLYRFSEVNNYEMGIHVSREEDPGLYSAIYDEAMRLSRSSHDARSSVPGVAKGGVRADGHQTSTSGFCIRCRAEINLDPIYPYCRICYRAWKKSEDEEEEEEFCHICGERNASSLLRPACYQCWKKNKDLLKFPLVSSSSGAG